MAPAVRKIHRLLTGAVAGRRGQTKICFLLILFLIFTIKIILLLLQYTHLSFVPSHPNNPEMTLIENERYETDEWKPSSAMLARMLKELNLKESEVPEHLPLTLDSRLWLNNASRCLDGSGRLLPLDVLFLVHTAPNNFRRRLLMRSTTGGESHFRPFKVRVVFLLGQVLNSSLQQALDAEHAIYGDLVQGTFLDTDANLAHKGVLGLRWAYHYCSQARYIVKLDDFIFFDTFKMLMRHRSVFVDRTRSLLCHVLPRGSMRIRRGHASFWAVEENQFSGQRTFPYSYCSGAVVVMTWDLIPDLFRAAFITPVFWIEDVYLFGMLPAMVGDVSMVHLGHQNAFIDLNATSAVSCLKRRRERCSVLATVCHTTEQWEELWNLTYSVYRDPGWRVPNLVLPPNS